MGLQIVLPVNSFHSIFVKDNVIHCIILKDAGIFNRSNLYIQQKLKHLYDENKIYFIQKKKKNEIHIIYTYVYEFLWMR